MLFSSNTFQHLAIILSLSQVIQAGVWIISIETARSWMAGFVGDVAVCFHFNPPDEYNRIDDQNFNNTFQITPKNFTSDQLSSEFVQEDCQKLPVRHFERGKRYKFAVSYAEDLPLSKVKLSTKPEENGKCPGGRDLWHIEDITFHNMKTGQLFKREKELNDYKVKTLFLESACGNHFQEVTLDNFNISVQPRPCNFDVMYEDGERFEDGCASSCYCKDGSISCVSLCPPTIAIGCRPVFVPGQCCTTHICENDHDLQCPTYEENDCDVANRTVDPTEYPWSAFIKICDRKECNRFCSGTLLNERWILTAAECVLGPNGKKVAHWQLRVIVGEYTLILSEDQEVEFEVVGIEVTYNIGTAIAMLKLKEPVVFDRAVQPAVLPVNKDMCRQLIQPGCALSLTGWINIGSLKAEQYDLYKLSTKVETSKMCDSISVPVESSRRRPPHPSKQRDNGICLNLANDEPLLQPECGSCSADEFNSSDSCIMDKNAYLCTGERGRALTSKVLLSDRYDATEINYLVGIISYVTPRNETLSDVCRKVAYKMAVNICHDLNWINAVLIS